MNKIDELINSLLEFSGDAEDGDVYIKRMLKNALKIKSTIKSVLDRKIISNTVEELRRSCNIFDRYDSVKKVTIFGSARCSEDTEEYLMARDFASKMADSGYMIMTGAGGGIMAAGNEGAGRERSFGLNIKLPFEAQSNPFIDGDEKNMLFRYFFTRKLMMVKETDAIVFFPGGFGTLDECMETLTLAQTGKAEPLPMVMIDSPERPFWKDFIAFAKNILAGHGYISGNDFNLFHYTSNISDACEYILNFYRNYHSLRVVGDKMVIRVLRKPSEQQINKLNEDFCDILKTGKIELSGPLKEEIEDSDVTELPRLVFVFEGKKFGRLMSFIIALNELDGAPLKTVKARRYSV